MWQPHNETNPDWFLYAFKLPWGFFHFPPEISCGTQLNYNN